VDDVVVRLPPRRRGHLPVLLQQATQIGGLPCPVGKMVNRLVRWRKSGFHIQAQQKKMLVA